MTPSLTRQARLARARMIRHRLIAASLALFVAMWLLIAVVLVSGHDPALAARKTAVTTGRSTSTPTNAATSTSANATTSTPTTTASSTTTASPPASSASTQASSASSNTAASSVTTRQS